MEPKDITPVELRDGMYLNREALLGNADWWDDRDESVMVWIVGGPLR